MSQLSRCRCHRPDGRISLLAALGALLLVACGNGSPGESPPPPTPAAAPDAGADAPARDTAPPAPPPDAAPSPLVVDAAPCPVPAPVDVGTGRSAEYPPGPFGIAHCEVVAQFTFKKADDSTISLAQIRQMPAVKVVLVLEADSGQERTVQALNPIYDELQGVGVFMMAVLVDPNASGPAVMQWQERTGFRGVSVHGNRLSGRNGITSGFPNAYVIHASTMQIQTRLVGFGNVTTPKLQAAVHAAVANAPP
jgi:hypothetical protein